MNDKNSHLLGGFLCVSIGSTIMIMSIVLLGQYSDQLPLNDDQLIIVFLADIFGISIFGGVVLSKINPMKRLLAQETKSENSTL